MANRIRKRNLTCSVCGEYAGYWEQHENRDDGHGLCAKCAARYNSGEWTSDIGEGINSMESLYGKPGLNYPDMNNPQCLQQGSEPVACDSLCDCNHCRIPYSKCHQPQPMAHRNSDRPPICDRLPADCANCSEYQQHLAALAAQAVTA